MWAKKLVLITACTLLAGCHESLGIIGDASMDTLVDSHVDTLVDTGWDPGHDISPEPAVDTMVDTEPPPPCPPPNPSPDGPVPYWEIDDVTWPPDGGFSLICSITELATGDDNSFTVFLACADPSGVIEEHTLYVRSLGVPFWLHLFPGEEVLLEYIADPIWWVNRWFALSYSWGELIIAGVDAEMLVPEGVSPDEFYYPLRVSEFEAGWCPPDSTWCGRVQRRGLEVEWGGITAQFVDRTYGSIGFWESVQVHVGETHRYIEMDCDDVPYEWVSALFVMSPEG